MTTISGKFSAPFTGVEFKDDTIVITCLKNDFSGVHVLYSSTFPSVDDDETVSEINSFISQYVSPASTAFVSIPYQWSIVKFIEVPSPKGKGKDAFINMMKFEIEKHIPFPVEGVSYDLQVIQRKETTCNVLITAVQREKIDYVNGFLDKLSLNPQIVTLSPFSLLNSIEYSGIVMGGWRESLGVTNKPDIFGRKDEFCITFLMNANEAYIAVLKGGLYIEIKSFAFNQENPLDIVVDDITREIISLKIDRYQEKVKKIILTGTSAFSPELSGALEEKLDMKVQSVNSVAQFFPGDKTTDSLKFAPSIGACYMGFGLGSLRINLLPHKKDFATGKTGPLVAKIALFLILFLVIGILSGVLVNEKQRLENIEEALRENEPKIKVIENLSTDLRSLKQKRDFMRAEKERDILLDILSELTRIIPTDAWLTNFDYKEIFDEERQDLQGELIVSGQASSSSVLISILENSPLLEEVEFVGSITKRRGKEGFKIKAAVVRQVKTSEVISSQIKRDKTEL
jgi:hypothetical protein